MRSSGYGAVGIAGRDGRARAIRNCTREDRYQAAEEVIPEHTLTALKGS
jgi:hypothetical protein